MSAHAELSAVATTLDDVLRRVTAITEGLQGDEREAMSNDLYEVERTLGAAQRTLARLVGQQRR